MAEDQVTEVVKTGYFQRIMNSFGGILMGIILFFGAFVLLYWNEGRVDLSQIAKHAVEISSTEKSAEKQHKLVHTSGMLEVTEPLTDGMYVRPGNYVSVRRNVEMYAWKEESESKSEKKLGGSEETTTTYSYVKDWTTTPAKSARFKKQEGHFNPELPFSSEVKTTSHAKVGVYHVDPSKAGTPAYDTLTLSPETIDLEGGMYMDETASGTLLAGSGSQIDEQKPRFLNNTLYLGKGSPTNPVIGDIRISYSVVRPGAEVTVIGKLSDDKVTTYIDKDNNGVYSLTEGSFEQAIKSMADTHKTMGWIWRVVGFFMMWIGLSSILGPISTIMDVLPFLGSLSRGLINTVTFIISFILSLITIVVSMILHNLILMFLIAIAGIAATVYILQLKGKTQQS